MRQAWLRPGLFLNIHILAMRNLLRGVSAKFIIPFIFCAGSFTAWSQAVGTWTFNNTLVGTPGTHNTVSNASFGSGVTSSGFVSGMYYGGGWTSGPSINTSMYLQFSLTPNAGYPLNLASIEITMRRGATTGQGPKAWSIRSSQDGFAADIQLPGSLSPSLSSQTVNLNASHTNLSTTIIFRIYGYDASGSNPEFAFDNIVVKQLTILPSSFISLTGKIVNDKNTLTWNTDANNNAIYFEVERSVNGTDFNAISKVYKQNVTRYTYTDNSTLPERLVWYRIKSVEATGSINYSDILKLQKQDVASLAINKIVVSGNQIICQIIAPANGSAKITLVTLDGKIITQQSQSLLKGTQSIQVNRNNTPGVQVLTVLQNNQLISRQFVN